MEKILIHILKNFDDNEFDHIIKNILTKIFDIYYLERDIQLYNSDNVFKKYNMDMYNLLSKKYNMDKYNLLSKKYTLTKSKKIIFIKHKYNEKEYIINLLKKNKNLILEENETYKSMANKILKSDIDCYTKYINSFCSNKALTWKEPIYCYHPPCFNKVIHDNFLL